MGYLNIDTTPFGLRIGLVVDNYAEFDKQGIPFKLLIGPAATRNRDERPGRLHMWQGHACDSLSSTIHPTFSGSSLNVAV